MKVAIIGCGVVGSMTARLLLEEHAGYALRSDVQLDLKYLVDLDFSYAESHQLDSSLFCNNYETVLKDPEVDIIVELVGGITTAKNIIEKALQAQKHVVTANKALLAHFGSELLALAEAQNVCIAFEASCGGGIPLIRSITDGLIANRISALYGILNGTCNYILTEMTSKGKTYPTALKEAQKAGLAEADPFLDVSGTDTSHKLAILAALAFGQHVDFESIPVSGIDALDALDVAYGRELGYTIKLLAIAKQSPEGLSLRVQPAFISWEHPLAWVSGPFNAASLYGHAVGHTMYYGRGAGGKPTASAVLADLHAIANGSYVQIFKHFTWPYKAPRAQQLPLSSVQSRFYLRINVIDSPGVLAQISQQLGDNNISISSVLQKEPLEQGKKTKSVPVIITTYTAREGNIRTALQAINKLPVVKSDSVCLEILDEHMEFLA